MDFLDPAGLFGDDPDFMDVVAGGKLDFADIFGKQGEDDALDASEAAEAELLDAQGRAIAETRRATTEGQEFLQPFGGVGLQGAEQAGFLTDPQAQFDFLQNNPLFQLSLDNANRQTQQGAAARGRLSAGDTFEQLSNNVLLSAAPLIQGQKQSIGDLLNFGGGIATNQANVAIGQGSTIANAFENQGNILAGGIQGRNQIQQDTAANNRQLALTAASFAASDPKLKTNKKVIGNKNGFTLWSWDWNELANKVLGLTGSSEGVMADEVKIKQPSAIKVIKGFMHVNYPEIGVL